MQIDNLKNALVRKILVLDGAMGTMIQRYGLAEEDFRQDAPFSGIPCQLKGNNECLNFTRPEIIAAVHREYVEAGADIIEANTFSANRISQKEYGLGDYAREMAFRGARIAREVADSYISSGRKVWVAGSVGPTSKSLTLAPDIEDPAARPYSFDEYVEVMEEQIGGLLDGGVDVILIETCFDALNTKAALYALDKLSRERGFQTPFPAIVSVSANDRSGRTLTGQTVEAFYDSVRHYPLTAFGINCSLGADDLLPMVRDLSVYCSVPVICYPNAGLPNEMGGYDETPEQMVSSVRKMLESGSVNIIGGCCGTSPGHIKAVADAVGNYPARIPAAKESHLRVSGLESVIVDLEKRNFTNVGERTNVAGSRKFARLIASGDYESAMSIAAGQIDNGASIIDVNMDDAMLDSTVEMEKFVRWIQNDPSVAKAALMIDSSHWETILAGLKSTQGRSIVNSISLKDGEEVFVEKALEIHWLGAAMVVMAFDEQGQAVTFERKRDICARAYRLLTEKGIPAVDLIFDVNVLSVGTGIAEHSRYAVDFIEAVRWIKANLPGASVSGGISNLSFAFRGNNTVREAMHSVFLYHAVAAGLDMGIVNPGMLQIYDAVDPELRKCVEDVVLDTDGGATERLIAKAQEVTGTVQEKASVVAKTDSTPAERLSAALVQGRSDTLAADVEACFREAGSAVKVIEGPLMSGMEKVGELFGAGKMFLPQVVKSAKIMRDAVAVLEPYMKEDASEEGAARPVIVNATVKGDVHDIGKNITGIVLSCNGFDVHDLGVMVDKERIISEALRLNASIIGVSGLITPSLFQMEELCREMTLKGLDIPLFIGGATTSALHTAVKLAPLYGHVFYSADASSGAVMAKKCLMDRRKFEEDEHVAQEKIRILHEGRNIRPAAISGPCYSAETYLRPVDHTLESRPAFRIPVSELVPLFDWRMFLAVWGVKYTGEQPDSPEIKTVMEEGKSVLDRYVSDAVVTASIRFFEAFSKDGFIDFGEGVRLPMLRQEEKPGLSMCDYVPDASLGFTAPFGMFAVSVHAHKKGGCTCEACNAEYEGMMERSVRVTLAEAASVWIDRWVEGRISAGGFTVSKPAAGYASCPDHSLKKDILSLLPDADKLEIRLTESFAMIPDASICGFIVTHRHASYPEIRCIGEDQYRWYAQARGFSDAQARQFLGHLL